MVSQGSCGLPSALLYLLADALGRWDSFGPCPLVVLFFSFLAKTECHELVIIFPFPCGLCEYVKVFLGVVKLEWSSLMLWGHFLLSSGHPSFTTCFKTYSWVSFSISILISASLVSLTDKLLYTVWTWMSMPSHKLVSASDTDYLDNVSATGISLPGLWVIVKQYLWCCRIVLWSPGGAAASSFWMMDSNGLWSLSTMTCCP